MAYEVKIKSFIQEWWKSKKVTLSNDEVKRWDVVVSIGWTFKKITEAQYWESFDWIIWIAVEDSNSARTNPVLISLVDDTMRVEVVIKEDWVVTASWEMQWDKLKKIIADTIEEIEDDTVVTVTFKDYDGTTLETKKVLKWSTPEYTGETQPAEWFLWWNPELWPVTENTVYTALNKYEVIYKSQRGSVLRDKVLNEIVVKRNSDGKSITIMDRNLWATELYWQWKCFIWWNLYPLDSNTTYQVRNATHWEDAYNPNLDNCSFVDMSGYSSASNPYSSSELVGSYGIRTYFKIWSWLYNDVPRETRTNNIAHVIEDLRWWDNDAGYSEDVHTDLQKQWPCPEGYHIPRNTEYIELYNLLKEIYWRDITSDEMWNMMLLPRDKKLSHIELRVDNSTSEYGQTITRSASNTNKYLMTSSFLDVSTYTFTSGILLDFNSFRLKDWNLSEYEHVFDYAYQIRAFKNTSN